VEGPGTPGTIGGTQSSEQPKAPAGHCPLDERPGFYSQPCHTLAKKPYTGEQTSKPQFPQHNMGAIVPHCHTCRLAREPDKPVPPASAGAGALPPRRCHSGYPLGTGQRDQKPINSPGSASPKRLDWDLVSCPAGRWARTALQGSGALKLWSQARD
jgi:hypothetical protein